MGNESATALEHPELGELGELEELEERGLHIWIPYDII